MSEDCNAGGGVCTVDPQCAKTVTDTLGAGEDSSGVQSFNYLLKAGKIYLRGVVASWRWQRH